MFCRVAGVTALGLCISGAAWAQSTQGQGTTGTSGTGTSATDTTGGQTQDTSTTTQTTTTTTQTDMDTSDRPRLEIAGFAGYTFNDVVNVNSNRGVTTSDVNFYNSIGPRDRFSYGATIGYDVTPNLQVGFLWSRMSSPLELRGFSSTAALAAGWSGPAGGTSGGTGATGTGGTGTGGTGAEAGGTGGTGTGGTPVAVYPVLTTTNGFSPYRIGDMDINTFHGTVGWNFGPVDSVVRPFVFGGAGVTRYGEVSYQFMNTGGTTVATTGAMTTARIQSDSRFSTTWGVGVKIAPTKGLGVRIAGRWTPTRLAGGNLVASSAASGGSGTATGATGTAATGTGTSGAGTTGSSTSVSGLNNGWWCDAYWGCFGGNKSQFLNQFSLTGGLTVRF